MILHAIPTISNVPIICSPIIRSSIMALRENFKSLSSYSCVLPFRGRINLPELIIIYYYNIARTTTTQQQACSPQNQACMFKESRWKRWNAKSREIVGENCLFHPHPNPPFSQNSKSKGRWTCSMTAGESCVWSDVGACAQTSSVGPSACLRKGGASSPCLRSVIMDS